MATIKIRVTGETCTVAQQVTFTAGSYGVYVAEVITDASWDDLALELCIISAPPGYPRMPDSGRCIKRSIPIKGGTAELDETTRACMISGNAILIGLLGCDADGKITRYSTVSAAGKVCGSGCVDDTMVDESRWAELISYINATIKSLIGTPTDEQVQNAVNDYASEHGLTTGATAEQVEQIKQNTTSISQINNALSQKAGKDEIPTVPAALPNPQALRFTGAVTDSYDGSKAVTINIPETAKVEVDSSLSVSGQAADAKAVGDALKKKAGTDDIPKALPNPNALVFTGAATGSYDGSQPIIIDIPEEVDCDTTLTQSGKAADAKVVGDALKGKADSDDIPTVPASLPNPNALTFTGAVTGSYDGSEGVVVNIPEDVECDTTLTLSGKAADAKAAGDAISKNAQDISNTAAQMEAMKSMVSDITESDEGILVSYGDGTSKNVPTKSTDIFVEDIDETEEGYRISYSNGDTKELAGKGTGGTSTSGGASITRNGDATLYCIYGDGCPISYNFNAFDASGDTVGAGVATWYVNGIAKATGTANQGDNEFDIGPYLAAGSNSVKLSISVDTGGDTNSIATKTWTVNAVNLYFEWERDDSTVSTTDVAIRWTPYGDLSKTTHIIVDGVEIATSTTTRSGTLQTYVLSALPHGSHLVEMYITAVVNGLEIKTNSVYHDFLFAEAGNTTPIIGSSYAGGNLTQYDTVAIPIVLYDPSSITANADVYIDDEKVTTWTNIDRTVHYWNYSPTEAGTHVLKMVCGETVKTWTVTVTELDIDNAEVEGYTFRMKASEFAGNDALQAWSSNGVTATFSDNFDWANGGIQSETDSNGNIRQFICVKAGTTLTINHKLFGSDCTTDGKNVKVMFRLANCRDYDAQWLSCYSGGIGLRCFAQQATLNSEQSDVSVPYYEGTTDPIELEFDVTPKSGYSYIMPWIDGVRSGVKVYPANDAFVQPDAQNIVIGSDDCDVYLYMIKAYPNDLTEDNHLENFIADAPNPQEMLDRFNRNDILDSNGKISYLKLAQQNPDLRVHVYDIVEMFKGDKEANAITGNSYRMFLASQDTQNAIYTAENVKMKIQGTSSVGYYDASANWDSEFTEGLTDKNGNHIDGISMTENSMPISYQNNKVNQASCEGANNAILADWYNTYQPYIRPYRYNTPMVRDTMEFQPGVAFFRDKSGGLWSGDTESYNMYAVIACGNSKKNYAVFHDPNNAMECCMEVVNNTSDQCLMIVECSDEDVRNTDYFEFRYPKQAKATDAMFDGWKRFVNWMYESNPNGATGNQLSSPVTFGDYTIQGIDEEQALNVLKGTVISDYAGTYTHDTFEYRMAKMLSECEDYMVLDSVSYHYLFIERHTMIDNVAKNTFWGSHDLLHWYLVHDYDNDTADGNDNEGGLTLTYGYEAMDTIGTKNVFNASQAVWFNFIHNLYTMNRVMYINREAAGAWDVDAFLKRFTDWQSIIPERVKNRDYWYKYLRRYEQNADDGYLDMLEGGQKTYQRWQFEVYQGAYMASKYIGSAASNDRITMRTYTPTTIGLVVTPKNEITITMYAKMYITILVGSIRKQIKAERGQAYTLTFSEAGNLNDTETYIYSASMVQAIGDISHLYPGYMAFANAIRLRSIQVSSTISGYINSNATSLTFGANKMLETLICPNLPNVAAAMDLSGCQSLRYIDARGSGFTGFAFANGGVLETALLPSPASISLRNLYYLATFSMESYEKLTSVTVENTDGVDSEALLIAAVNLVRVRIVGADWSEVNGELTELLERLYSLRGRDENDSDIEQSVVTGAAWLSVMRVVQLNRYNTAWPNLAITYGTMVTQYTLKFVDWDGSPLLDKNKNPYVQYVDRGSDGYDPIEAGEIETPTRPMSESTVYTFSGWDDNFATVISDRTITAQYTETARTYTLTWRGNNGVVLETQTVAYGSEAVYGGDDPTKTDEEDALIYYLFSDWNKSTGYVTEDMIVDPVWIQGELPEAGTDIGEMNEAQIYGITKSGTAQDYVAVKDEVKIRLGYIPEFDNVENVVLAENLELDGQTCIETGIQLMKEDADWTIVVDCQYSVTTTGQCMVGCFEDDGYCGFKFAYNSGPAVQWGTNSLKSSRTTYRDIMVLRHHAGDTFVTAYTANPYALTPTVSKLTKSIANLTDAELCLGAWKNPGGSPEDYATGKLWYCRVWYGDLGDAIARKMVSFPRENCAFQVAGRELYRLTSDTTKKTSIDFICRHLLDGLRGMNSSNVTTGGWEASAMREWMNSRLLSAFPAPWRAIIKQVRTSATAGDTSSDIVTSDDYLFIPNVVEMSGISAEPYVYEGKQVPWFTSDPNRNKFRGEGMYLRDGFQYVSAASQPDAEASGLQVGDLWRNTNEGSRGYLYLGDAKWYAAYTWWLRDASLSSAAYFGYVNINGHVNTNGTSASASYGVCPRFSI